MSKETKRLAVDIANAVRMIEIRFTRVVKQEEVVNTHLDNMLKAIANYQAADTNPFGGPGPEIEAQKNKAIAAAQATGKKIADLINQTDLALRATKKVMDDVDTYIAVKEHKKKIKLFSKMPKLKKLQKEFKGVEDFVIGYLNDLEQSLSDNDII